MDGKPFAIYNDDELRTCVVDDLYLSISAMDYLETTGNELLATLARTEEDTNQTADITEAFDTFLRAAAFSESLTDTHRYFASIPYRLWNERVTSFLISYSLYVKKYEIIQRMIRTVSNNEYKKKVLNEYMPSVTRDGIYYEMASRFYAPKTRLRISGGYLYLYIFARPNSSDTTFQLLHGKAVGSYTYLRTHFTSTLAHTSEVLLDTTEQHMFDAWFPIQKNVATAMGRAILTTRGKNGFITPEQALDMGTRLAPGDILLQRRNWHISNVGIPGFWTHSAIYTGDLTSMDVYFSSEFPYEGHTSLLSYLKAEIPNVYTLYSAPDTDGHMPAVVEAIERGVVVQSLPISADADFVAVLHPKLSKHDTLLALIKAFKQIGKPYDFDLDTRDALVCSELIYDAYLERPPEKNGLHFTTEVVNGRKVVTPLSIANKYVAERNTSDAELSFVYFLRGDESTQVAQRSDEHEFIDTIHWSKFTFLQK